MSPHISKCEHFLKPAVSHDFGGGAWSCVHHCHCHRLMTTSPGSARSHKLLQWLPFLPCNRDMHRSPKVVSELVISTLQGMFALISCYVISVKLTRCRIYATTGQYSQAGQQPLPRQVGSTSLSYKWAIINWQATKCLCMAISSLPPSSWRHYAVTLAFRCTEEGFPCLLLATGECARTIPGGRSKRNRWSPSGALLSKQIVAGSRTCCDNGGDAHMGVANERSMEKRIYSLVLRWLFASWMGSRSSESFAIRNRDRKSQLIWSENLLGATVLYPVTATSMLSY